MKDFRGLKVWEKSHALALTVYKASAAFPSRESFGMTAQVRRACSLHSGEPGRGMRAADRIGSLAGMSPSRWVQPASWSTTFCCPGTLAT